MNVFGNFTSENTFIKKETLLLLTNKNIGDELSDKTYRGRVVSGPIVVVS